jgi:hypothetical protein
MDICDGKKCGLGKYAGGSKYICCHNNISVLRPDMMLEWHPENTLDPRELLPGSTRRILWKCNKAKCDCHVWETSVAQKKGCPFCSGVGKNLKLCIHNSLQYKFPEIAKEWDFELNKDVSPLEISHSSNNKAHWICKSASCGCDHKWIASICNRTSKKSGCPFCNGGPDARTCIHNNLKELYPQLETEWCYELNNKSMDTITQKSNIKYWWKCSQNHEWQASPAHRTSGTGCPSCYKKTETKLYNFLSDNIKFAITCQKKFDWCANTRTNRRLPFDFYIEIFDGIIIELDGPQHFTQTSNWKSPEKTQNTDVYKMMCAVTNNISVIRLLQEDVFLDKNNWKNKLMLYIKKYDKSSIIYLSDTGIYDQHKTKLISLYENVSSEITLDDSKNETVDESDETSDDPEDRNIK